MWFSDIYRRHLLDMHIDDWDDSFLSEFSPEQYVQNLITAKVNYAMLYLQSHVGLCNFPTKAGTMHRAFAKEPDKMKRLCDLCHSNNIKVVGYYSLIYNTVEHDKHPEWRILAENGKSERENRTTNRLGLSFAAKNSARYGHLCPNNEEYRRFVETQIDEMAEYFDLDGFFFDMPFWPYSEYCHCEACKKKYYELFGEDIPINIKPDSPELEQMVRVKAMWMAEFIQGITDYIKAKYPSLSVEHNYAAAIANSAEVGCARGVGDACDYVGGDLYGDLYYHSFACKFFLSETLNQPFENMISRCKPGLRVHTVTRSTEQLKTNIAVAMAHHGATMLIDAIDPVGTMDSRVYEAFGRAFDMEMPYEKYFKGELKADVGIYYDASTRTLYHRSDSFNDVRYDCVEAAKTLISRHILCGCVGRKPLSAFSFIIAPRLKNADCDEFAGFVENGGTLLITGAENRALVERLTGATVTETLNEEIVYLAPTGKADFLYFNKKYPLPYDGTGAVLDNFNGDVLATLTLPYTKPDELRFASIHSNPPGIATEYPAITVNRYGKGTVIWFAFDIESVDIDEYREIFANIIAPYITSTVKTDAPSNTELTLFEADDGLLLNTLVLDESIVSAPVAPFSVSVKCDFEPAGVALLPEEAEIKFVYSDGAVTFTVPETHIFSMIKIKK